MIRLTIALVVLALASTSADAQLFPRLRAKLSPPPVCTGPECQGFVNPIVPAPPAVAPMPMPAKPMFAADPQVSGTAKVRIVKRIAEFRAGVKAELERRGVDPADVAVVGQLGDGKLLEWILTHGPDIIKFVEELLALFGK